MKFPASFLLRHAILTLGLLVAAYTQAQDNTGNKPGMAGPGPMAAEHAATGHKEKIPSATLTIILQSARPAMPPANGDAFALSDKTLTLTPADIAALPHETVTVVNGHTNAAETYSGVPIASLLSRMGLPFEKANEHALLKTYFVAEGTDGYRVLVSVYETFSTIRGSSAIVADTLSTSEGPKPLTTDGAFKLVIPGDKRPQRWVQNLKSITFKTID